MTPFDPRRDLLLERVVDVPPALVWACWTQPEHLVHWFTPAPWRTTHAEIDLRPGGVFRTVMQGPEGPAVDNAGCILEAVPEQRLVWTGSLGPGYRPNPVPPGSFGMTAILTFAPEGAGTRYTARVLHADASGREQHEQMGFTTGWSMALQQLVDHAKTL